MDNAAPVRYAVTARRQCSATALEDGVEDPLDAREVFDHVRGLRDPEHPLSLEALRVVQEEQIAVGHNTVAVRFTPTVPHCSMAALIGLAICTKLRLALPPSMKVSVQLTEGSHSSEEAVNKQLADKERVAASLENPHMMAVIGKCLIGV